MCSIYCLGTTGTIASPKTFHSKKINEYRETKKLISVKAFEE